MIDAYDKVIKNHIESFMKIGNKRIKVIGLQNEEDAVDSMISQVGDHDDTVQFPVVSVFRRPEIDITDGAMTKKPTTYQGYVAYRDSKKTVSVRVIRCDLHYGIDVFAENKKTVEDLACQLFFRLRNNPNPIVSIQLPVRTLNGDFISVDCVPNIVMSGQMRHLKSQNKETEQLYRLRIEFTLQNVNIYDFSLEEFYQIEYSVQARLLSGEQILNSTESKIYD